MAATPTPGSPSPRPRRTAPAPTPGPALSPALQKSIDQILRRQSSTTTAIKAASDQATAEHQTLVGEMQNGFANTLSGIGAAMDANRTALTTTIQAGVAEIKTAVTEGCVGVAKAVTDRPNPSDWRSPKHWVIVLILLFCALMAWQMRQITAPTAGSNADVATALKDVGDKSAKATTDGLQQGFDKVIKAINSKDTTLENAPATKQPDAPTSQPSTPSADMTTPKPPVADSQVELNEDRAQAAEIFARQAAANDPSRRSAYQKRTDGEGTYADSSVRQNPRAAADIQVKLRLYSDDTKTYQWQGPQGLEEFTVPINSTQDQIDSRLKGETGSTRIIRTRGSSK